MSSLVTSSMLTPLMQTGGMMAPTTSMMSPMSASPAANLRMPLEQQLMTGGLIIGAFGAINSAIGSYFAAQSEKNRLKGQALNAKFASEMAALNARGSEFAAQRSMESAHRAIGRYTMGAGQAKASARTAIASRGIEAGTGSARDVIASMDLVKEIDRLTMDANAVREAEALRTQAFNFQTQGTMDAMTAANMRRTAGSISAPMAGAGSLLGGAADMGAWWMKNKRAELMMRNAV
jgi:hypothetical protein